MDDDLHDELERLRDLELLDLSVDATQADIKHAYRQLVQIWHPDRFEHDQQLKQRAENELKKLNAAYERLTARERTDARSPGASPGSRESRPPTSNSSGTSRPRDPVPPPPPTTPPVQPTSAPASSSVRAFVILAVIVGLGILTAALASSGSDYEPRAGTQYSSPTAPTSPSAAQSYTPRRTQPDFYSPPSPPFWGAFVYASTSQSDVDEFAAGLRSAGFEPYVLSTLDYSSIGKPGQSIWVVTSGAWPTQSAASAECSRLAAAGYVSAYPKIVEY